jgi:phage shock protein PspC (stress-responsive transcriptional regulator)
MKKTITINISGLVFNIEEDAYASLKNYLESIGNKFNNLGERQEIIEDIEARIAELFSEKLNRNKEVINQADVDNIISVMGSPDNFEEEETTDYSNEKAEPRTHNKKKNKKFYRDTDKMVLGGVCAGASNYFDWDVALVRVIFMLSVIFLGTGVLIYIIFWIATPEAKSTSEKLAMKGKKANVDNISSFVTKVKTSVENINTEQIGENIKTQSNKFNDFLIGTSKKFNDTFKPKENGLKIVRSISSIIGFIIISVGVIILTNIASNIFAKDSLISDVISFRRDSDLLNVKLLSPELFNIAFIIFNITLGISLIVLGLRMVFYKNKEFIKSINPIGSFVRFLSILSLISIIIFFAMKKIPNVGADYSHRQTIDYDTIVIKKLDLNSSYQNNDFINFSIEKDDQKAPHISIKMMKKGGFSSMRLPDKNFFDYKITDSIIEISPYYYYNSSHPWEKNVEVTLYLPDNDSTILINEFDD